MRHIGEEQGNKVGKHKLKKWPCIGNIFQHKIFREGFMCFLGHSPTYFEWEAEQRNIQLVAICNYTARCLKL